MDEFRQLERLARERRCRVTPHRVGFEITNRTGHVVHLGRFADTEKFLKSVALATIPDSDTRNRVLTAAARKRRFWFEQIGEDEYRLNKMGGHREIIFESVDFRTLIAFLDDQEVKQ